MSELLRDPLWQFVGVVAAFGAIIISIVLFMKSRSRKSLSYLVVSITPLLSVKAEIKRDLQILYKGKPIEQVHLIIIKVINSGNVPVIAKDFERPFSLIFGEEAQVLTAEVVKTVPDVLRPSIKFEARKVVLDPILLNGGDSITLKLLVSRLSCGFSVDARIVGVREIKELGGKRIRPWIGIIVESALAGMFGYLLSQYGTEQFVPYLAIGGIAALVSVSIVLIFREKKSFSKFDGE
jgi:hypothetical protein